MEDAVAAFRGQLSNFEEEQEHKVTVEEILKKAQIILQKDAKLNYCKITQDV